MKPKLYQRIGTAIALVLVSAIAPTARAETIQIQPQFSPDPMVVEGRSGGATASECGYLGDTPNHVLEVGADLPYLRIAVEGTNNLSLLIDGPGGRFCVLADSYTEQGPEMSGLWTQGTYQIYIGDRAGEASDYRLYISHTPN